MPLGRRPKGGDGPADERSAPPAAVPETGSARRFGRKKDTAANASVAGTPPLPPSPTRKLIEARAPMKPGTVLPLVILVVGTAGIGYGGMTWKRESVQEDLRARSLYALSANGYPGLDVTFTGRDGVITGTVDNVKDAALVHRIVRTRVGVRHVDDRLVIRGIGKKGSDAVTTLVINPLNATIRGATINFTGGVPSEDARFALIGAAAGQVGNAYVIDALSVDKAGPRGVLSVFENFGRAVGTMVRDGLQNGIVTLDKGRIRLDGSVWSGELRKKVHDEAARLVGEPNVSDGLVVVTTTAPTTTLPPTTVPPSTLPPTTTTTPAPAPAPAPATTAAPGAGGTGAGGTGGTGGGGTGGPGGGLPTTMLPPPGGAGGAGGAGVTATTKALAPMSIPSTTVDPATRVLRKQVESILKVKTIEFAYNSAELTPRGRRVVGDVAKVLLSDETVAIEVGGHTDWVGSDADNFILSQARAATVRDELIRLGVGADRIRSTGYGEIAPVADNNTLQGRALNRRIEFGLVKIKPAAPAVAPTTTRPR